MPSLLAEHFKVACDGGIEIVPSLLEEVACDGGIEIVPSLLEEVACDGVIVSRKNSLHTLENVVTNFACYVWSVFKSLVSNVLVFFVESDNRRFTRRHCFTNYFSFH